jgi:hypothetical protein
MMDEMEPICYQAIPRLVELLVKVPDPKTHSRPDPVVVERSAQLIKSFALRGTLIPRNRGRDCVCACDCPPSYAFVCSETLGNLTLFTSLMIYQATRKALSCS